MDGCAEARTAELVEVILEGGPGTLPTSMQVAATPDTECLKVPSLGGYEHFERADDRVVDGGRQAVFRWTMRTAIAE
ncbi:MAG TPA: DUF5988 family protein [Mycobacteriales bacterium]|jgi:hypothetical protein|nr:DUF5988 family protein [Mycobacteriales bacterium]